MTITLDQLRELAKLNMDKKHYEVYLALIEPNIESMLKEYLKGWQNLETVVLRIVMRAKGAYKTTLEVVFSEGDNQENFEDRVDISIYNKVAKMNFYQKIKYLHEKGIIGNSIFALLDFLRKRRNKIHGYEPAFSEIEREAFSLAYSIMTWFSIIDFNSGLSMQKRNTILQSSEIQASNILSKLKEILSKPMN